LLGDRGRAVAQCAGDRAQGSPLLELAQETEPTEIEWNHPRRGGCLARCDVAFALAALGALITQVATMFAIPAGSP
jgi:hypothetical protein